MDATGPMISITSPSSQGKDVVISGTVSDGGTTSNLIKLVLYDSNMNQVSDAILTGPNAQGSWSFTLSGAFADRTHNYKIKALDAMGNSSIKDYSFTVDTAGPSISTNSPVYQRDKQIVVSGTVTDPKTPANLIQMQLLDANSNPITNTIYSGPTSNSNQWSYTLSGVYGEGTYTYKVKATNTANHTSIANYSVTVDNTRPKVTSIKVNLSDKVAKPEKTDINLLQNDITGYAKINTPITFTMTDDKMVSEDKINNSILVFSKKGGDVSGTFKMTKKSDNIIDVTFTPTTDLEGSTTYYLLINPGVIDVTPGVQTTTDAAGNTVYPLIRKFATEQGTSKVKFARMMTTTAVTTTTASTTISANDPHGNYAMNTNTCATCHSTHASNGAKLEDYNVPYSSYNYCMACHDGTVAAAPDNILQNNHFSGYGKTGVQTSAGECASCHNPHLTWNEDNPNLIKDHYIVENHPAVEGVSADMFDSEKQL